MASDGETTFANEELSKKIALYYHSLVSLITINTVQFQGSLAQWFIRLQQRNFTKLTKKLYLELNVKI